VYQCCNYLHIQNRCQMHHDCVRPVSLQGPSLLPMLSIHRMLMVDTRGLLAVLRDRPDPNTKRYLQIAMINNVNIGHFLI